ncbi:sigma-70 family RNA polymerase sigma factor [Aerococcaceae bacterium NML210727]|nr:sigma-70 family RNA polymerase sigma factor [Aerococcaceae bacterium NML210727]MCW6654881.1 sigma-70 family RNA polymerase sigma factor [Aerococcaceae bacterium NML201296]
MSSYNQDTGIELNKIVSLTPEDERRSYQLLKLIRLRIAGLRVDLLRQYIKDKERVIPVDNEMFEPIIQENLTAYYQTSSYERGFCKVDLAKSLQQLSDREYQLIEQHFIQGMNLTEIAKQHNVSVQAISKQKKRILKKLRQLMNGV